MVILLQSVTHAAKKIGLTTKAPTATELATLADTMFSTADRNLDDRVSANEFEQWCVCVCVCVCMVCCGVHVERVVVWVWVVHSCATPDLCCCLMLWLWTGQSLPSRPMPCWISNQSAATRNGGGRRRAWAVWCAGVECVPQEHGSACAGHPRAWTKARRALCTSWGLTVDTSACARQNCAW